MDHPEPHLISTSGLVPVHRSGTTPFSQQTVVLTKQAYIELKWEANYWPACGKAFAPFPGAESSDVIEIQVQAHMRRIQRPRYHKTCQCPQVPGIVTAPPAPRVIPKSPLGVSVWTMVLLDKYLYGRPTHRFCEELRHYGLPLAQGTLTDGLQRIAVLFEPLRQALHERQMGEKLFHGDETRWEVFEEVAG